MSIMNGSDSIKKFEILFSARWLKIYLLSAGIILLISGLAKLVSASGNVSYLQAKDPILEIHFRYLFCIAGFVEIGVAILCFFGKNLEIKAICIGWLSTFFAIYRISLLLIGYHRPCPCLGNLTSAIHVDPHLADLIMKVILGYLLVGSYVTLFLAWLKRRKALQSINS